MLTYEDFVLKICQLTGIDLSLYKEKQMKRRINSLILNSNYKNYDDYYKALTTNKNLYNEFINYITINVTEFFRNLDQWIVLENEILPYLIKKNLKIWSAACSTGEEPYTLAMILSKYINLEDVNIIATDIDANALAKAQKGIYTDKSLEKVPAEYIKKFFTKVNNTSYIISETLRKNIIFKKHNLLTDKYPENVNLVICRNVLIYFNDKAKNDTYKKIYDCLSNDGVFFVGGTEQIILPYRYNFEPIKTFFYKKISNN
ncbi:MAG: protein-glutamate O-methyltransferase CheR [Thermoanaerobacteraceae bacterium]|nr:protein-glutamate O-methyltransferase CheR [Thermoanaerobacteraceae bacterium]